LVKFAGFVQDADFQRCAEMIQGDERSDTVRRWVYDFSDVTGSDLTPDTLDLLTAMALGVLHRARPCGCGHPGQASAAMAFCSRLADLCPAEAFGSLSAAQAWAEGAKCRQC
jgi:hypothetical protein